MALTSSVVCLTSVLLCLYVFGHFYIIPKFLPNMMQLFLNLDLEPSHPFLVFLSLMNINIITLYCHYVLRVLAKP